MFCLSGLQEYIEAVSFYHYLKNKKLVSLGEIKADLTFSHSDLTVDSIDNGVSQLSTGSNNPETQNKTIETGSEIQVFVPPTEYMLGVADLTGELMRLAVSSVGKGDLDTPVHVKEFLQLMLAGFVSFGNCGREIGRKLHTLKQSLQKVETACYTIQVRGSEIPKHMLVDVLDSGSSGFMGNYDNDTGGADD